MENESKQKSTEGRSDSAVTPIRTHALTDEQVENIMHPAINRMGGGDIQSNEKTQKYVVCVLAKQCTVH